MGGDISRTGKIRTYAVLLLKVLYFSLPMLALLGALEILPTIITNWVDGRETTNEIALGAVKALKLWALFYVVMTIVCSLVYWGQSGKSKDDC